MFERVGIYWFGKECFYGMAFISIGFMGKNELDKSLINPNLKNHYLGSGLFLFL
jgi:hypothetical protein